MFYNLRLNIRSSNVLYIFKINCWLWSLMSCKTVPNFWMRYVNGSEHIPRNYIYSCVVLVAIHWESPNHPILTWHHPIFFYINNVSFFWLKNLIFSFQQIIITWHPEIRRFQTSKNEIFKWLKTVISVSAHFDIM